MELTLKMAAVKRKSFMTMSTGKNFQKFDLTLFWIYYKKSDREKRRKRKGVREWKFK